MIMDNENNGLCYTLNDLCVIQDRTNVSRKDKRKQVDQEDDDEDDDKFKSKNLNAERRRRKKLSDRQLELRSIVPIITNMNKASIITDAITYIEELKRDVEELSNQLLQMETATRVDESKIKREEIDDEQEMKTSEITPEVEVSHIPGMKVWIKIVFQKKRGAFTKLMEAITALGFNLSDTSVTTSRGAVLLTSSGEGIHGGMADADQIKKRLLEIVRSM